MACLLVGLCEWTTGKLEGRLGHPGEAVVHCLKHMHFHSGGQADMKNTDYIRERERERERERAVP